MRRSLLGPFFRRYGWWYVPGMLFLVISVRLKTGIPQALGRAIDLLADVQNTTSRQVAGAAGNLALLALGVFCAVFIWRLCVIGNGRRMERFLRGELFAKLLALPEDFFAQRRSGELLTYLVSDANAVRQAFGSVLAVGVNAILTALLSIVSMAGTIDPRLTLFALLPVPLAVGCLFFLGKLVRRRFSQVQGLFSTLSGFVNESILGAKVIKSFSREEERQAQFDQISGDIQQANVALVNASSLISPAVTVIFGVSWLISILYGSNLVLSGQITVGALAAFLNYLALVQTPVLQLGKIINNLQRGVASYRRIRSIMDEPSIPPEEFEAAQPVSGDIQVKDLTFRYPGQEADALSHVSFTVKPGQKLGIAGTTGSGKTTLLSLLLKFYPAPAGSIFIGGKDIRGIPAAGIRSSAGYVAQDGFLFSESIAHNIDFYRGRPQREIERAAALAGVDGDIAGFPEGYNTQVGERGTRLSGGQKQRISLARALVGEPALLLLDDTLSAVDARTEQKITQNLETVLAGKTAIIVSHRLSALKNCDLILYLDKGRVVEQGAHEELCALGGLYAAAWAEQEAQHGK